MRNNLIHSLFFLWSHLTGQAHVKSWVQFIPAAVSVIGGVLGLGGSKKAAAAQEEAARLAREKGREQNAYNKMAAKAVEATGQQRVFEIQRQTKIMASRAVAVAAAGGYAQDITNLIADIDGEGNYRESIALYEAGEEAEGLRHEGRLAEKYGIQQAEAYHQKSLATTLSGQAGLIASIGKAYGQFDAANG